MNRRGFIKTMPGLVVGLAGFRFAHQIDDPRVILNQVATSELFAAAFYLAALKNIPDLTESEQINLKAIAFSEWTHYQLFASMRAETISTEFYVPNVLSDKKAFASVIEIVEADFVAGYLATAGLVTSIADETLAVTMAQIAVVEAQHLALVRQLAGLLPNHSSFVMYSNKSVTDSLPHIVDFLSESSSDLIQISIPADAEMEQLRVELEALGYDSSVRAMAEL